MQSLTSFDKTRKGFARQLMEAFVTEDHLLQKILYVDRTNNIAIAAYTSLGWYPCSTEDRALYADFYPKRSHPKTYVCYTTRQVTSCYQ